MFYPSVRDAAAHSDNGAQVKVSNRTYRVVLSDNRFCVTRESHSGCFTNMLYRLGWPKGEITRKIEAMLNSSTVSTTIERGSVRSNRPDLCAAGVTASGLYSVSVAEA